jgi:hypothetical protein
MWSLQTHYGHWETSCLCEFPQLAGLVPTVAVQRHQKAIWLDAILAVLCPKYGYPYLHGVFLPHMAARRARSQGIKLASGSDPDTLRQLTG